MKRTPPVLARWQRDALTVLQARLNPRDAGNTAAPETRAALELARRYLDTWVLPLLWQLEHGADYRDKQHLANDAYDVRRYRVTPEVNPAALQRAATMKG